LSINSNVISPPLVNNQSSIKSSIILIADLSPINSLNNGVSAVFFVRYEEEFERSEHIVLPWRNPFQEYDDAEFRQRFRLSKIAVIKLLDEIIVKT